MDIMPRDIKVIRSQRNYQILLANAWYLNGSRNHYIIHSKTQKANMSITRILIEISKDTFLSTSSTNIYANTVHFLDNLDDILNESTSVRIIITSKT